MKEIGRVRRGISCIVIIGGMVILVLVAHINVKSSRASYGEPVAFVGTNVDKAVEGQQIEAFIEGEEYVGDDWEGHSWDPGQRFPMPFEDEIKVKAKVNYFRRPEWLTIDAVPKTVEYDWDAPIMFKVYCSGEPDEGGFVQPVGCDWVEKGSSVMLQAFANEGWKVKGDSVYNVDSLEGNVIYTFVFFEKISTED